MGKKIKLKTHKGPKRRFSVTATGKIMHAKGMKLVLDGVFNHASRGIYFFNDILENGPHSAWLDWFIVHDWPLRRADALTLRRAFSRAGVPALADGAARRGARAAASGGCPARAPAPGVAAARGRATHAALRRAW